MPRKRKVKPFYLRISDHDSKVFNIIGPMTDDRPWNEKVAQLQNNGRKVNCGAFGASNSKDYFIREISAETGYKYTETPIVNPPEDRSMEYTGPLPDYAKGADRKRLVQLLCKGKCNRTRWAEMTVDFPGEEVLRNSDVFSFSAKCLKCGAIAKDPYNWFR